MRIVVIDGQGGRIGRDLIELLRQRMPHAELVAIGTNSIATGSMLRAGADMGATGENPVLVTAQTADVIVGPLGIIMADAMLGEITPAMAAAVSRSPAKKVLVPVSRCATIAGVQDLSLGDLVRQAVEQIVAL